MTLTPPPDTEDDLGSFAQAAAQERDREAEAALQRAGEALLESLLTGCQARVDSGEWPARNE